MDFDPFDIASRYIFRLEGLPEYRVPEEESALESFMAGGPVDLGFAAEWVSLIAPVVARGCRLLRLRLVSQSLTDYERFEIFATYRAGARAGEDIRIAARPSPHVGADFFAYDDRWMERLAYDAEGHHLGSTITDIAPKDMAEVKQWMAVYDTAEPLGQFVANLRG
jgi:hypothetical protein